MDIELQVAVEKMQFGSGAPEDVLIENLSFAVRKGKVVSLVGPTGAGKSTLFRIIAGLEKRFNGHVTLQGKRIDSPVKDIQIVFQDYRLLPFKTVINNLLFAGSDDKHDVARAEELLNIFQLSDKRDSYPKILSGGEAGRVALARAFMSPPKLLLLDEPFSNLDYISREILQDFVVKAVESFNTTTLLITHSPEDAVFLSDEIHILKKRPLQITNSITIDLPKPRDRYDHRLTEYRNLVSENLRNNSLSPAPISPANSAVGF